jgi:hypothetical protein
MLTNEQINVFDDFVYVFTFLHFEGILFLIVVNNELLFATRFGIIVHLQLKLVFG